MLRPAIVLVVLFGGCGPKNKGPEPMAAAAPTGLQITDKRVGDGAVVADGDEVVVHYTGYLADGSKFDSSHDRSQPLTFQVGAGRVIPGWEQGLPGMKVGGLRELIIPPDLAYGERGAGGVIPGGATLRFDIELLDVRQGRVAPEAPAQPSSYVTTTTGLQYADLTPCDGEPPHQGGRVVVEYSGFLEDGTLFDSSLQRPSAFRYILGSGRVIQGWEEGLATMSIGCKRQLVVPPELGYGDRGVGPIPAGATLTFDVEMVDFAPPAPDHPSTVLAYEQSPTGLKYKDLEEGDGAQAAAGKTIVVDYSGWLDDGTRFDSSLSRNDPLRFQLGAGRVIKGWDEGVVGMKVGGRRQLVIPPELGYGEGGKPPLIPAGSTLTFEVTLLAVED